MPAKVVDTTELEGRADTGLMTLHVRAAETARTHLRRAVVRRSVLLIVDMASFGICRAALRAFRDDAVLGGNLAEVARTLVPRGTLDGAHFAVALIFGLMVVGAYRAGDPRRDPNRILRGVALGVGLALWQDLWIRGFLPTVLGYAVTVAGVGAVVVTARLATNRVVGRVLARIRPGERVAFIGDPRDSSAAEVSATLAREPHMEPVGWVTVEPMTVEAAAGHVWLGTVDRFVEILRLTHIDTVVLCNRLPDDTFQSVVAAASLAGCRVLARAHYDGLGPVRPALVAYHKMPFIELTVPALRGQQFFLKRVVDLFGAALGLLLLSPILALAAIAIRLDSPGPVFFRQERIGRGGRSFRVWKFRTMHHGASEVAHRDYVSRLMVGEGQRTPGGEADRGPPVYKLRDDPRVTRVGRVLRRTSLDELPQLLNVLGGEMSLVGPRPPLPYEVQIYDTWQYSRLGVLPGITGLWQVSGRNLLTYREMCELDNEYVLQWSVWLDLKILWRTVPVVLFNSGRAA